MSQRNDLISCVQQQRDGLCIIESRLVIMHGLLQAHKLGAEAVSARVTEAMKDAHQKSSAVSNCQCQQPVIAHWDMFTALRMFTTCGSHRALLVGLCRFRRPCSSTRQCLPLVDVTICIICLLSLSLYMPAGHEGEDEGPCQQPRLARADVIAMQSVLMKLIVDSHAACCHLVCCTIALMDFHPHVSKHLAVDADAIWNPRSVNTIGTQSSTHSRGGTSSQASSTS